MKVLWTERDDLREYFPTVSAYVTPALPVNDRMDAGNIEMIVRIIGISFDLERTTTVGTGRKIGSEPDRDVLKSKSAIKANLLKVMFNRLET